MERICSFRKRVRFVRLALATIHSDEKECDICLGQDIKGKKECEVDEIRNCCGELVVENKHRERTVDYISAIERQSPPYSGNECM